MAQAWNRISPTKLKGLAVPGFHADGGGLYVRVRETGGRSFVFVSTKGGKRREITIGPVSDMTLAEARAARDRLRRGEPLRQAGGEFANFGEWADHWVAGKESEWGNAVHRKQWKDTFKVHAKALRGLPIEKISTDDVVDVLRPLWTTKNETASRVRGRIEKALDAARSKGLITGLWENPARWRGHLENLLPKRAKLSARGHHAAMPWADVPAFTAELRKRPATAARALEFCILAAARTGEVIGATWGEIDLAARKWSVPAARMKMKTPHEVPLTDAMMEVLDEMGPGEPGGYIFPGGKKGEPLSNMAMLALLRRMGHGDLTVHGFRSAFRDWAGEATEYAAELAELALAHSVGDSTVKAYRRERGLERRRPLMADWAEYLGSSAAPKAVAPAEPPAPQASAPVRLRSGRKPKGDPTQTALFGVV